MKRKLLVAAVLMGAWNAHSQVGIGTLTPDSSSQLDVVANDKGVLLPRVALESTTDTTTITNGNVNSLLVFNTNTQNDVTPGYYYWYEDKWMRIVNEKDITELDKNTTNVSFVVDGGQLVLIDSDGNTVSIPLSEINIPTTLVNNGDGTYTYTNESGETVTIDVPADVVNNFEEIIQNGDVINELIENLGDTIIGGNVSYDGDNFTYIDENGVEQTITFEDIVQANETVTTLVNNGDGTYTYTNESGETVTIDVPADIVNQFDNIVNNGPVTVDGNTYNTIEEYIQHIVEANETVTNLVYEATTGIATYTNEEGTPQTIDLSAVVKNFETLTSVSVDNTAGTLTYVDEKGNTNVLNLGDLVKAQETVTNLVY